jgi:hypothetical protein
MKNYFTIKLDISFPEYGEQQLVRKLEEGWHIFDKTILGSRYIYYVLKRYDPDYGKCGEALEVKEK